MYQITNDICDFLLGLPRSLNLTLLVSAHIFSTQDWKSAQACYAELTSAGRKVHTLFIHQREREIIRSHFLAVLLSLSRCIS